MAKLTKSQIEYTMRRASNTLRTKLSALDVRGEAPDLTAEQKHEQITNGTATFSLSCYAKAREAARNRYSNVGLLECFDYRRTGAMLGALRKYAAGKERYRQANVKMSALMQELEDKLVLGDSDEAKAALAAIESVTL